MSDSDENNDYCFGRVNFITGAAIVAAAGAVAAYFLYKGAKGKGGGLSFTLPSLTPKAPMLSKSPLMAGSGPGGNKGLVIVVLVVLGIWYFVSRLSTTGYMGHYTQGAQYPDVFPGSDKYEDARYTRNLALVNDRYSCSACKR